MAQRVTTSWLSTSIPGAYPNISVKSQPVGLGASGNVVIIGEADGGESFPTVALKSNYFTPDQLSRVQQAYISGPIVDAMQALASPSNDADIVGTANRIYVVKTNTGTKASAIVDTDYGTLQDLNWGKPGNKYKYQITSIAAETAPTVSGATIAAFGVTINAKTFAIRLNGGASTTVLLSSTPTDHDTIAHLITEINLQLPVGITASAGTLSNSLKLTVAADSSAYRRGWGKSFELVEVTPGHLASLGLIADLTASSQEPGIEVQISRSDTGLSETLDVDAEIALEIGYAGTTGTVTINQTTKLLTTSVTGGSGTSLSLDLTQFRTVADLASYINTQTDYSAASANGTQQLPTTVLDEVTTIGICSPADMPGRIKKAAYDFQAVLATSRGLEFVALATAGLPNPMTLPVFLSGGTKGGTSAADVISAINTLAGISVNIVIPLFSRDYTADIVDGLTESSSTYTIDAIHAAVKNHVVQYSTPKLKRHRIAILSYWGTYADTKAKAQGLASYRCSLAFQRPTQVNSAGVVTSFLPWYGACVASGMQAGGFYKSITNKFANVISFEDPSGFDSGSPGDVEDALDAGLLAMMASTAGSQWISDQTTYGFDTNFVYNTIQAVYLSDILALDLASSFQNAFTGKSLADVDASTALSFLAQKMDGYKKLKMVASSDDAPLGWKNAAVSISGPEMDVKVEIKLTTAIYFIPIDISISQVTQTA